MASAFMHVPYQFSYVALLHSLNVACGYVLAAVQLGSYSTPLDSFGFVAVQDTCEGCAMLVGLCSESLLHL